MRSPHSFLAGLLVGMLIQMSPISSSPVVEFLAPAVDATDRDSLRVIQAAMLAHFTNGNTAGRKVIEDPVDAKAPNSLNAKKPLTTSITPAVVVTTLARRSTSSSASKNSEDSTKISDDDIQVLSEKAQERIQQARESADALLSAAKAKLDSHKKGSFEAGSSSSSATTGNSKGDNSSEEAEKLRQAADLEAVAKAHEMEAEELQSSVRLASRSLKDIAKKYEIEWKLVKKGQADLESFSEELKKAENIKQTLSEKYMRAKKQAEEDQKKAQKLRVEGEDMIVMRAKAARIAEVAERSQKAVKEAEAFANEVLQYHHSEAQPRLNQSST